MKKKKINNGRSRELHISFGYIWIIKFRKTQYDKFMSFITWVCFLRVSERFIKGWTGLDLLKANMVHQENLVSFRAKLGNEA